MVSLILVLMTIKNTHILNVYINYIFRYKYIKINIKNKWININIYMIFFCEILH